MASPIFWDLDRSKDELNKLWLDLDALPNPSTSVGTFTRDIPDELDTVDEISMSVTNHATVLGFAMP